MNIALITGAYRGLGYETARQLTGKGWHVVLTARQAEAGKKAADGLHNASFIMLDVDDPVSIRAAAAEFAKRFDHLDVLVNNAAIIVDGDRDPLTVDGGAVLQTLTTNAVGPLRVTQAFLPLLKKSPQPRVINVSSGAGQLNDMGTFAPAYSISKAALNAVTGQFAATLAGQKIAVNSVCPGWCRTEMGGPNATRSVEEGVDTIVWLATDAPLSLTGQFLRDRKPIPW